MKPLPWHGSDIEQKDRRDDRLSILRIVTAIRRRKLLVTFIVVIVTACTYAVVSHMPPRYTAEAVIMIEPRKSQVTDIKSGIPQVALDASTIRTEAEVLRSIGLANRVATALDLIHENEFRDQPSRFAALLGLANTMVPPAVRDYIKGVFPDLDWPAVKPGVDAKGIPRPLPAMDDVINRLQDNLIVWNDGRSAILKIRYDTADPKLGAAIVNAYTKAYIDDQLASKSEATVRAGLLLNERVEELRGLVLEADRAVQTFRDENRLTEARGMTMTAQQVAETNSQLTVVIDQRLQKEADLAQLNALRSSGAGIASAPEILSSPTIIQLKAQEAESGRRLAELTARYGENYPLVLDVREQLASVQLRLGTEAENVAREVTSQVEAVRARESALQSSLTFLEERAHELDRAQVHLLQLEQEAKANRELYEHFLMRAKETGVQKYFEEADARVLSPALVPKHADFPQLTRIVELAALLSLVASVALAMLLESFDHTFVDVEDLEREMDLASFGLIPEIARGRRNGKSAVDQPTSAFSESIRWVRTSLEMATGHRSGVIMITSSASREGKTTLSTSLGRSAAQSGQRVLLIDCDMRFGTVGKVLEPVAAKGLEAVIAGSATLVEAVTRDSRSGLDFITTRHWVDNPQALLGSQGMQALIQEVRQSYELVILDSPPVLAVSDAMIIAKLADATILLVRSKVTLRSTASKALRELRKVGGNVVGVVLTRVDLRRAAANGYTLPELYDYAAPKPVPAAVAATSVGDL